MIPTTTCKRAATLSYQVPSQIGDKIASKRTEIATRGGWVSCQVVVPHHAQAKEKEKEGRNKKNKGQRAPNEQIFEGALKTSRTSDSSGKGLKEGFVTRTCITLNLTEYFEKEKGGLHAKQEPKPNIKKVPGFGEPFWLTTYSATNLGPPLNTSLAEKQGGNNLPFGPAEQ